MIATARHTDAEMTKRINHHILDRGDHWSTVEAPLELPECLMQNCDKIKVIDCLGVWLTNILVEQPERLAQRKQQLLCALSKQTATTLIVSNESGLGVIGADPLTRQFIDELGKLNQRIATQAESVVMTVSGLPLWLKGSNLGK